MTASPQMASRSPSASRSLRRMGFDGNNEVKLAGAATNVPRPLPKKSCIEMIASMKPSPLTSTVPTNAQQPAPLTTASDPEATNVKYRKRLIPPFLSNWLR